MGRTTPKIAFPVEESQPHLVHGSAILARLTDVPNRQTDRQTTARVISVAIKMIYAMSAIQPNNIYAFLSRRRVVTGSAGHVIIV